MATINTDLVNTLGNLLSRSAAKGVNPSQTVPMMDPTTYESVISLEDREMFASLFTLAGI